MFRICFGAYLVIEFPSASTPKSWVARAVILTVEYRANNLYATMQLQLLGPHPFEIDQQSGQRAAIGTIFPSARALYTRPPQLHAYQRLGFIDYINEQRASQNLPRDLQQEQEDELCTESVDLIFEPDAILIRPDPDRMDLAFAADELLQELASKRQIKFLKVNDGRVRDAIKARGECWRLSSLPRTSEERRELVFNSKVAIQGLPLYFYNRLTGTRWLTVQTFSELANLDDKRSRRTLMKLRSTRRVSIGRARRR